MTGPLFDLKEPQRFVLNPIRHMPERTIEQLTS